MSMQWCGALYGVCTYLPGGGSPDVRESAYLIVITKQFEVEIHRNGDRLYEGVHQYFQML